MTNSFSPPTREKRFVLIKLILLGFFVWFFSSSFTRIISEVGKEREFILEDLMEGKWWIFFEFFHPISLFEKHIVVGGSLTIALIIGLYLGLRREGKAIFIYPTILFCITGFLVGVPTLFLLENFITQTLILFCFSQIISTFFYYKKENLLLPIAGIILIILIGGSIAGGKYFTSKLSKERKELENKLIDFKERAIETKNPELCEEIEKTIKKGKSIKEGGVVKSWSDMLHYYRPCIEELAIKTGDEILCERINKVEGDSSVYSCRKMVKAIKTNNLEECAEICKCVTYFAVKENNPDICEKCEYYSRADCFSKIAFINSDIEICEKILQLNYFLAVNRYDRCITDIAVKQNDPELCKKVKEAFYIKKYDGEEEKIVTFTIDKCLEEVKSKIR